MPADDRLGLDKDQMPLPIGDKADQQPKEPVLGLEVRARMGTESDLELVSQEQVLDQEVVPSAKEPVQCGE